MRKLYFVLILAMVAMFAVTSCSKEAGAGLDPTRSTPNTTNDAGAGLDPTQSTSNTTGDAGAGLDPTNPRN